MCDFCREVLNPEVLCAYNISTDYPGDEMRFSIQAPAEGGFSLHAWHKTNVKGGYGASANLRIRFCPICGEKL